MSFEQFWLMEEYDVVLVVDLLALGRAIEIDFGIADDPGRFSIFFKYSIVYYLRVFEDRALFTHAFCCSCWLSRRMV